MLAISLQDKSGVRSSHFKRVAAFDVEQNSGTVVEYQK